MDWYALSIQISQSQTKTDTRIHMFYMYVEVCGFLKVEEVACTVRDVTFGNGAIHRAEQNKIARKTLIRMSVLIIMGFP